jgi:hypothetical protein
VKTIGVTQEVKELLDDIQAELKKKLFMNKVSYDTVLRRLIQAYKERET